MIHTQRLHLLPPCPATGVIHPAALRLSPEQAAILDLCDRIEALTARVATLEALQNGDEPCGSTNTATSGAGPLPLFRSVRR